MHNISLWKKISTSTYEYLTLEKNLTVDVAIIGAGITGVTAALSLLKAGKKVAIFEADEIGGVTTGFSTGNLYIATQPYYQNIVKKFDLETAQIIGHSRKFAIDYIEKIVKENNFNCSFTRRPWYAYTNTDDNISVLEKELETLKKMNFTIDYTETMSLPFAFKKAAIMHDQARFNPLQYVIDLAASIQKKGCLIFKKTRIVDIQEKEFCVLHTADNHQITANKVIIATHTPIGVNPVQFFTAPYRSYVTAVRLENNNYPEGHFWDLDEPHHATCTHSISSSHPELLMVAGSHHKVGQGIEMTSHYKELEKFLRQHFSVAEVVYQWSAQHYQSADNIPYIGLAHRFAKHTYIATGFFADGLVYGTVAGILLGDLILERENLWKNAYYANRFKPMASMSFLITENSNYIAQYYKDFPQPSTHHFEDLKAGEAKIVDVDQEKCGVYRDEKHKLHVVSAICTHMKCLVNWNDAEKTWDCPCHGSRFTHEGKVIEGPAKTDLKKKEI